MKYKGWMCKHFTVVKDALLWTPNTSPRFRSTHLLNLAIFWSRSRSAFSRVSLEEVIKNWWMQLPHTIQEKGRLMTARRHVPSTFFTRPCDSLALSQSQMEHERKPFWADAGGGGGHDSASEDNGKQELQNSFRKGGDWGNECVWSQGEDCVRD